jgi:hypothetical protein
MSVTTHVSSSGRRSLLNTRQKIVIGGLGALTPIAVNLLVIDFATIFVGLTPLVFVGYVIRVVILFYLGGLVAFLHKDEHNRVKLFELGIVAPALITGLMNAARIDVPKTPAEASNRPAGVDVLVAVVYAQDGRTRDLRTFSPPPETAVQQVVRGLTGLKSKRVWFVIAGSSVSRADAEKLAAEINSRKMKDLTADVYAPYDGNRQYAVVIRANLTYGEAKSLRQRAVTSRLRGDPYLWTLPGR